jgi:hypothetical protein
LGVRWPGLINFPEINLRFYVRKGEHRGVMFIKEIVPRRLISAVARRVYDEPYCCAPIEARITQTPNQIEAHYRLAWPGIGTQHIRVRGDKPPVLPDVLSLDHWIKEHQWGFTGRPGLAGGAWVYEVIHPVWTTHPLIEADVRMDFACVYGPQWASLNHAKPVSVVFAVGSEISVFPRQRTLHVRWPVRQQSGDLGNPSPISRGASTGTGGAA